MTSSNFHGSEKKNIFSSKNLIQNKENENLNSKCNNSHYNNQYYSETEISVNYERLVKKKQPDKNKNEAPENLNIEKEILSTKDSKEKIAIKTNKHKNFRETYRNNSNTVKTKICDENTLNLKKPNENGKKFKPQYNNTDLIPGGSNIFHKQTFNLSQTNTDDLSNLENYFQAQQKTKLEFTNKQTNASNDEITNVYKNFNLENKDFKSKVLKNIQTGIIENLVFADRTHNSSSANNYAKIESQKDEGEMKTKSILHMNKTSKNDNPYNFLKSDIFNNKQEKQNFIPNIICNKSETNKNIDKDKDQEANSIWVKMPNINNLKNSFNKEKNDFKSNVNNIQKNINGRIPPSQSFKNKILDNINTNKCKKNRNIILLLEEEQLFEERKKFNNKFIYDPKLITSEFSFNHQNKKSSEKKGKISKKIKNPRSDSRNTNSIAKNNDISFSGECSKIINENELAANENKTNKVWKIIDFDYVKHKKLLLHFSNDNQDTLEKNNNDNKCKEVYSGNSSEKSFIENNIEKISNNIKLNEILQSTGNLNHKITENKRIDYRKQYDKNNFKVFSEMNSDDNKTKFDKNFLNIAPSKTCYNFAFKSPDKKIVTNNINNHFLYESETNMKESIKPEEIKNIMQKVLENSKKEIASKSRDFLKNIPKNDMNLAQSQQRFYINNVNNNATKGERPSSSNITDKNELLNFFAFNLTDKTAWKKHEEFWALMKKNGKEYLDNLNSFYIETYILPPNDEDILLSYYCKINNINMKFCIDDYIENPFDEINKWKNAYKKVVMRWHPDKFNPIFDDLNIKDELRIKLNMKAGLIINNMNKNLKFVIGLLKRIINKREMHSKHNKKN